MTGLGVPLGANKPIQSVPENPGIFSAIAGTSGRTGGRLAELTPKATNFCVLMYYNTDGKLANAIWI